MNFLVIIVMESWEGEIHKCMDSVIILNHILWYCFTSLSGQHPKGRVEEHLCREMEAI